MDTVLGLSLTSTAVGWVLVEGHEADGAILDHDEFAVRIGGGARTVEAAEHVAAAVARAQAADDHRLHLVGITWSDDAAAGAALVVETLTAAGFNNVVPVRLVQAAETLAQGLAPVVGYDKTAVCVLGPESTTVVMVDSDKGETRTAVTQVTGGADGLFRWLTRMFARDARRPDCVVVVGADADLADIVSELDDALPVPIFAQIGMELALARGAALASAHGAGFTESGVVESADEADRFKSPSYAGALTALVAAAVTLVGSLSLALGLRLAPDDLGPDKQVRPTEHLVHAAAAPRVAEPPVVPPAPMLAPRATAAPAPAPQSAPEPPVVESPEPVAEEPVAQAPISLPEEPPAAPPPPALEPPPPDPHPLLTRILQRLRGEPEDPPPAQPPDGQPPSP